MRKEGKREKHTGGRKEETRRSRVMKKRREERAEPEPKPERKQEPEPWKSSKFKFRPGSGPAREGKKTCKAKERKKERQDRNYIRSRVKQSGGGGGNKPETKTFIKFQVRNPFRSRLQQKKEKKGARQKEQGGTEVGTGSKTRTESFGKVPSSDPDPVPPPIEQGKR